MQLARDRTPLRLLRVYEAGRELLQRLPASREFMIPLPGLPVESNDVRQARQHEQQAGHEGDCQRARKAFLRGSEPLRDGAIRVLKTSPVPRLELFRPVQYLLLKRRKIFR